MQHNTISWLPIVRMLYTFNVSQCNNLVVIHYVAITTTYIAHFNPLMYGFSRIEQLIIVEFYH